MRAIQTALVVFAVAVVSSCATSGGPAPVSNSQRITTEMLLDANPLAAGFELRDLSQVDVLELSPEMMAFLDRWVDASEGDYFKLRRLLYAVMGDGTFDLVYDDSTRTAQETFRAQRGNCLSFTNMFVSMGRYLGLQTKFQEIDVPPDWSVVGQTFVLNRHVNVHVDLETYQDQMVDFNIYDFRTAYDRRVVPDKRARAYYFNNIGAEQLLKGATIPAFENLRESLREDSEFGPAWINLGILSNRKGYPEYAEAAYLKALAADGTALVAMSNLASLYEDQGRSELAAHFRKKVESHRMQNPYFRYQLARTAFDLGDYKTAISHLRFSIRKNRKDDSFYFLLSLSYLNSGQQAAAQRWMKKAEEVAELDADKRRYHSKLDLLTNS